MLIRQMYWILPDLSFGGGEMCVGETVALRGLLGVGDGLADAVDAVERLATAGDEAADGADAAVEIEHAG